MDTQIIGIRELHQNLKRISNAAKRGRSFTVVRNSRPVFRIEPIHQRQGKGTLADFMKIQFRTGNPNLSKEIDNILYGRE